MSPRACRLLCQRRRGKSFKTWAGSIHPAQALGDYPQRMGIPAKLVVVGMVSNGFSIANPDDAVLDVVGFDTATPTVIGDFARKQ